MFLYVIFIVFVNCARANDFRISPDLARDFFSQKYINQLVIFTCSQLRESLELQRVLMNHGMKINLHRINDDTSNMRRLLMVNYYKLGVIIDLDCEDSDKLLERLTEERIPYNESYFWLFSTAKSLPKNLLKNLPLTVESELVVAVNNNATYELFDVYNPGYRHGGTLNVTFMGSWDPTHGLRVNLTQYKYDRRGNFHGLPINVSIVITHPPIPDFDTYISNPIDRHLDTMHRFNYALVSHLRDLYNFKMNLMRADSWGYLENGTFDGMLGDMIRGVVDIGATPLQFKEERIDVAEFTVQTWLARPCFIFRHPSKNSIRDGFSKPFSTEVWWLTLLTAPVVAALLWITVEIGLSLFPGPATVTLDSHPCLESSFIVLASLCQQGLTDGPRLYSGRIVYLFSFFWGFLLYQFYSASIVGSLLSKPPRTINTLKDLLESNLLVGIEDIAYNYDFFATTSDPIALKLYELKVAPRRKRKTAAYFTPEEGLRRVRKGGFAFHVDVATAYKIITDTFEENEICDLVEIQLFPPKHTATVTSKRSPFKKMVTYGMRKIIERGMGERLRKVWHYRRPICPKDHSTSPTPVSLEDFSPALFILTVGFAMSGTSIWAEKKIRRRAKMMK